ncbi:MAG: hypothetical protein WBP26_02710 [Candidatus Saccharimonadales bacterium]
MKVLKTVGVGLASLGLVVGLSGAVGASTGSISNTGPDSYNKVSDKQFKLVKVHNKNNLGVSNANSQNAWSGDASVKHNTTGGSATTGAASNANATSVSATVNNAVGAGAAAAAVNNGAGSNSATISQTGPDSYNAVKFETKSVVTVENKNNLSVSNVSTQTASSGDAKVYDNTTGGSATSGNASNSNTTSVNFNVTN